MNTQELAFAFAQGRPGKSHNARVESLTGGGVVYILHRTAIVVRERPDSPTLVLQWGGWHTSTTARHMNAVLRAVGVRERVSYAGARDSGIQSQVFAVPR